jgi:hypothetical protein
MSVKDKLASSLGRKDEVPNQDLAREIVAESDKKAIDELIEFISSGSKAIRADVIKTLYEVGFEKPELIAPHAKTFLTLLDSNDNRLQWGAMMALSTIAKLKHKQIYTALPKILDAAKQGSVITRDHTVKILATLASMKAYADEVYPLLIDEVRHAPLNQFPMYAEYALEVTTDKNRTRLLKAINGRMHEVERDSMRKRLMKVLKKLEKITA